MNRTMAAVLSAVLVVGCGPKKLDVEDFTREKMKVDSVVVNFWKAYEAKDTERVNKLISPTSNIMFFGTDSAEVIRSIDEWKGQMRNDMKLFTSFRPGQARNISTEIDNYGELASTVCEMPVDMKIGGKASHAVARLALTMKKEKGDWLIMQGMIAFASKGQSSAELLEKMKGTKPGKKQRR